MKVAFEVEEEEEGEKRCIFFSFKFLFLLTDEKESGREERRLGGLCEGERGVVCK